MMKRPILKLTVNGAKRTFEQIEGFIWRETDASTKQSPERRFYLKRRYPRGDLWFVSATCGLDWIKPLTKMQMRKLKRTARCPCGVGWCQ